MTAFGGSTSPLLLLLLLCNCWLSLVSPFGFVTPASLSSSRATTTKSLLHAKEPSSSTTATTISTAEEEAAKLLERVRDLREEIAAQEKSAAKERKSTGTSKHHQTEETTTTTTATSKWSVPQKAADDGDDNSSFAEYRLYVDIGREEGTWMEPRWGASGRRIEFTLDVRFYKNQFANDNAKQKMINDNQSGSSSPVLALESAPLARLRSGFDEMKCSGSGAYRIDHKSRGQSDALRFYVEVEGTPEKGSGYGDVFIPKGGLYFSIPCFGSSVSQLSNKGEMPVTVRQMGWHTGWRREESRIVGVFRAVPIQQAKQKDGF